MKKRLLAVLTTAMVISTFAGTTVLAEEPSNETVCETSQSEVADDSAITFDLNQLVMYRRLPDGTRIRVSSPRIPLTEHIIGPGETMEYYQSDGSDFKLTRGQNVTFKATFNRRITFECGLTGAGYNEQLKYGAGASFSVSKSAPADGEYYFWITNYSVDDVTVKNGSINVANY